MLMTRNIAPTTLVILFVALFVYAGRAQATDLSGTISSTVTIFDDSRLVGDITCAVPLILTGANPCIAFGADHIKLHLNGHTITGPVANPPTGCSLPSDSNFGVGIEANARTGVKIDGPGVIQKFQRWGILLLSSDHVTVRKVTANRNCWSGLQTIDTSDSNFEEDFWINNAAGSNGAACGGICLSDSNNNGIHKCTFYGNGSVEYANGNVDFGIGFEGSSSENRVEENDIGGNTNGVYFFNSSSDNAVRRNVIAGNPAGQVIKTFTATNQQGADIAFRPSFTGANNEITDNFCLTYIQGAGPATPPCPSMTTQGVEEAANRWTSRGVGSTR
jgi:parallel beta-helix repeat protein